MGDISEHISRHEIACKCGCGFDAVDIEMVNLIEEMMDHFEEIEGKRLSVVFTSGNRCARRNSETPGAMPSSQHTKGIAVDFYIIVVSADRVAGYLEDRYVGKYGIGRYNDRTHVDMRPNEARWDYRA